MIKLSNLYKLHHDAKPAELGGPPFIFGSALRVPSFAYPNWKISGDARVLYELSLSTYQDEFAETSEAWMDSVIEAAERSGLGNRPQMLRDAVADAAAKITQKILEKQKRVNVLDVGCGAGASLSAYLDALKIEKLDLSRVSLTCVDLSRQNLWKAVGAMEKRHFALGYDLFPVHSRDVDMTGHVDENSYDIVINVAGIHANAYLDYSMRAISQILRKGGYFVSGDWHHGRWLHPSHTFRLLEEIDENRFEWRNKGAVLGEFRAMFPKSSEKPDLS